jgi:hypothetical protein
MVVGELWLRAVQHQAPGQAALRLTAWRSPHQLGVQADQIHGAYRQFGRSIADSQRPHEQIVKDAGGRTL